MTDGQLVARKVSTMVVKTAAQKVDYLVVEMVQMKAHKMDCNLVGYLVSKMARL